MCFNQGLCTAICLNVPLVDCVHIPVHILVNKCESLFDVSVNEGTFVFVHMHLLIAELEQLFLWLIDPS